MQSNPWLKLAAVSLAGIVISFGILWGISTFSNNNMQINMGYGYHNGMQYNQMQYGMMGNGNMQSGMNMQGSMNGNMQGNSQSGMGMMDMMGNMNGGMGMMGGMGMH